MVQETFIMTSTSYTLTFNLPEYGGATRTLDKNLDLFNFWVGSLSVADKGIGNEPLVLGGIETWEQVESGLCFPICFDNFCFGAGGGNAVLSVKVENVWDLKNNGEEVTITGLGDTLDGVYVIRNFEWRTIKGTPYAFAWRFELEFVRKII